MKRSTKIIVCAVVAIILLQTMAVPSGAHAGGDLPTITDYHTPCANGAEGAVSTFHGVNRNGQPPLDHTRRTYDFHCPGKALYAPTNATVWGYTPKYGGVLLMQDSKHKVCLSVLGMNSFPVTLNQQIRTGDYIGTYGRVSHFTAVDGYCADANFYDVQARTREHPIAWVELGEALSVDIRRTVPVKFVSQNPGMAIELF